VPPDHETMRFRKGLSDHSLSSPYCSPMIGRKRSRLQYIIGLGLFMSFLSMCYLRLAQPLIGDYSYMATTPEPNVHVPTDNQAPPLGNSSSTTPEPGNWKNLPFHFNKSESGCRRQCQERRNKIVFDWYPAGLGDRSAVFQGLTDLAGYLCAVLEVPRPKFLLHRRHNDGRSVSINATWNDFFNFTFRQDGSPGVVDLVNPNSINERPNATEMYGGEDYRNWYIMASKRGASNVVQDFLQLEDYSFRQPPDATTGFIWILRSNYYEIRKSLNQELVVSSSPKRRVSISLPWGSANRELPPLEMLPLSPIGCSYQQNMAPLYIQNLARDMFEHIRQQAGPSSVVGSFHIRRGDTVKKCDTTLKRMKSYLQCSFNGTESRKVTLLFHSDERDQTYRSGIQTIVKDLGHTFIDLDALIKTFLKEAVKRDGGAEWRLSNYYVYDLSQELMKKVSFELQQHYKINCEDCNNLAGRADLWKSDYYYPDTKSS
jgi:hypothetical protein